MNKTLKLIIAALVLIFFGFFVGLQFSKKNNNESVKSDKNDYPLLAKRLFLDNPNDIQLNFSELRSSLRGYFTDNSLNGSLHFEYLPTGSSVRVNGDQAFRAASLMKLPVAMEFLKAVDKNSLNIDSNVALKEEWLNDEYGNLYLKGAGHEITLRELLETLLKESDNTALRAILSETENLSINDRALGALDIDFNLQEDSSIDISARSYSSFLKCLFFACYNSKENSEYILRLLTETKFNNRLVAGVEDDSIKVAHKIGVHNTQVQSDCGIIYYPDKPYLLCIILQGNNDSNTDEHFKNLSKIAFDYIKNN